MEAVAGAYLRELAQAGLRIAQKPVRECAPALELGFEDLGRYSVSGAASQENVLIGDGGSAEERVEAHYPVIADHPRFDRPPVSHARDNRDHCILRKIELCIRVRGVVEDLLCRQRDRGKVGSKPLILPGR